MINILYILYDSRYVFIPGPFTWSEAQEKCTEYDGSYLADIMSEQEQAFLTSISSTWGNYSCWIIQLNTLNIIPVIKQGFYTLKDQNHRSRKPETWFSFPRHLSYISFHALVCAFKQLWRRDRGYVLILVASSWVQVFSLILDSSVGLWTGILMSPPNKNNIYMPVPGVSSQESARCGAGCVIHTVCVLLHTPCAYQWFHGYACKVWHHNGATIATTCCNHSDTNSNWLFHQVSSIHLIQTAELIPNSEMKTNTYFIT